MLIEGVSPAQPGVPAFLPQRPLHAPGAGEPYSDPGEGTGQQQEWQSILEMKIKQLPALLYLVTREVRLA